MSNFLVSVDLIIMTNTDAALQVANPVFYDYFLGQDKRGHRIKGVILHF